MKKQLNTDINIIVRRDSEYGISVCGIYPSHAVAASALPGVFRDFLASFAEGADMTMEEVKEYAEWIDEYRAVFNFCEYEAEFEAVPLFLFPETDTAEAECRRMLGDIFGFEERKED